MRTYSGESRRISQPNANRIGMADKMDEGRGRFFVISKVVESPETLQVLVEWFRNRNIPCAIGIYTVKFTLPNSQSQLRDGLFMVHGRQEFFS